MADKLGDIFTDKLGISYELRSDPKGGHLRPFTIGKGGCSFLTDIFTAAVVGVALVAATEVGRIFWEGFKKGWKSEKF